MKLQQVADAVDRTKMPSERRSHSMYSPVAEPDRVRSDVIERCPLGVEAVVPSQKSPVCRLDGLNNIGFESGCIGKHSEP